MRTFNALVLTLVIIGGINWGLVGLFEYNLVDELFDQASWFTRIIYTLVGTAALFSFKFYNYDTETERGN